MTKERKRSVRRRGMLIRRERTTAGDGLGWGHGQLRRDTGGDEEMVTSGRMTHNCHAGERH